MFRTFGEITAQALRASWVAKKARHHGGSGVVRPAPVTPGVDGPEGNPGGNTQTVALRTPTEPAVTVEKRDLGEHSRGMGYTEIAGVRV